MSSSLRAFPRKQKKITIATGEDNGILANDGESAA